MLTLFPNRSRRDLKLKFKKEERINPHLINKALLHPNRFDIDELKQDFEREHIEMERMREEWMEKERCKREEKMYVSVGLCCLTYQLAGNGLSSRHSRTR